MNSFYRFIEFRRTERKGIALLVVLVFGITLLIRFLRPDVERVERILMEEEGNHEDDLELFKFDPDTLRYTDWIKLGLSPNSAKRLSKYAERGGKIDRIESLKSFGVDPEWIDNLSSYFAQKLKRETHRQRAEEKGKTRKIPISHAESLLESRLPSYYIDRIVAYHQVFGPIVSEESLMELKMVPDWWMLKNKENLQFETGTLDYQMLNDMDSVHFYLLTGKAGVAGQVVRMRNKLGGFVEFDQLHEINGLEGWMIDVITKHSVGIGGYHFIDLNQIELNKMAQHPYIGWKGARMIDYIRTKIHPINGIEELYGVEGLDSIKLKKLERYLRN